VPRPSRRREREALGELREHHSYMFGELTLRHERQTTIFSRNQKTGQMRCRPGVAIKLVVPEDSVLGQQIIEMRKSKKRSAAAKVAAKTRRSRARQGPRTEMD
jgi:hypothetical protein